ncbi:MAG: 30S ribosomal protein S18 [Candidatus Pacebacteria bacterium]|nr:30S ribosomal protein S18 [Candidatus Paceibacterota bacterium]
MHCFYCQKNIKEIDFKEAGILRRFTSAMGKIRGREKTNFCAYHQRQFSAAIKRARYLGLLPYVKE